MANRTPRPHTGRARLDYGTAALKRGRDKCVISREYDVNKEDEYPDELTADLEGTHILPF
ncbi:hypothetical protein IFM47457_08715 [Aspergillus lentulus]|nr:hypothetical protein IFM47457_08715 [Aspergillus lentulus]